MADSVGGDSEGNNWTEKKEKAEKRERATLRCGRRLSQRPAIRNQSGLYIPCSSLLSLSLVVVWASCWQQPPLTPLPQQLSDGPSLSSTLA